MSDRGKYFKNPMVDFACKYHGEAVSEIQLISDTVITKQIDEIWGNTVSKLRDLDFSDYTVYTGSAGIALLFLLHNPTSRENLKEAKRLLCLRKLKCKRQTFLCGDAGPLAIGAVISHRLGEKDEVKQLLARLEDLQEPVVNVKSGLPNEYLYGRAGYLFALLYVNRNINPPPISTELIRQVINLILICGQKEAKQGRFRSPLMYEWHDSYYLGAAHGLAGILYLLLDAQEMLTAKEIDTLIKPTLEYVLDTRFPSGNFPSSVGSTSDKYIQWCHGAPGLLYLFSKAYEVFHEQKYLDVALQCGDIVWERGLLRKGYSLCHGVAGNAYCFLELYQKTRNMQHLYRAIQFAEWCVNYMPAHEEHSPDRPLSLYEGIAGRVYLFIDIQKPLEAKFPGFSL